MAIPARKFDRLNSALFVAVLAHGIAILGITFAPIPKTESSEMLALNVTLLVDTENLEPGAEDARMLASRDQAGGGDDDSLRPTRTLTAEHPLNQKGEPLGADAFDAEALPANTPVDQLVSRSPSSRRIEAVPETTDSPAAVRMTAAALLQQEAPDTLAAELDHEVSNTTSEELAINSPNTRQSVLAAYMVGWRQRVERVGTANFPSDFLSGGGSNGTRPIVEVAISAGGQLDEVRLRRSSGNSRLDQATVKILELAGPFDPLPDAILADYDVLRFAYEWDFETGELAASRVR